MGIRSQDPEEILADYTNICPAADRTRDSCVSIAFYATILILRSSTLGTDR